MLLPERSTYAALVTSGVVFVIEVALVDTFKELVSSRSLSQTTL